MNMLKWLIAGLIGASVGGALWVAIGYFAEAEVGWIAWAIGLTSGIGVRMAADEEIGFGPGLVATLCALIGVVASKYLVVMLLVNSIMSEEVYEFTAADLVPQFADEIVTEWEDDGKRISWPPGMTFEDASEKADYPPEIWKAAEERLAAIPPAEQEQMVSETKAEYEQIQAMFSGSIREMGFRESWAPYDILWLGLAAFTAFKVGSALAGDD